MKRPLDGLVVLEGVSVQCTWGVRLAVALAGRIAADLGARVLCLRSAGEDPWLAAAARSAEVSALHSFVNAGKNVVTGLAHASLHANALLGDAWMCDSAGPMLGQELTVDASRAIVQVGIRSRGDEGHAPASEFTAEAESGLLDLIGEAGRAPLRLGGHQVAYSAGLAAYTGMIASLRSGRQQPDRVTVSLIETALWLNWKNLAMVSIGEAPATRSGQATAWPVVRCADGWVAMVYQPHEWATLSEMLADPRLGDPRFATPAGRTQYAAEIVVLFEECLARLTRSEVSALAVRHRLPLGAVQSAAELVDDPHYRARGFLQTVDSDEGKMAMPRLPMLWNGRTFPPGPVPGRMRLPEEVVA